MCVSFDNTGRDEGLADETSLRLSRTYPARTMFVCVVSCVYRDLSKGAARISTAVLTGLI